MKAIDRKVLRDLSLMRSAAVSIGLVLACGIATFVMSTSTLDSLRRALTDYARTGRLGHIFAPLVRAPSGLVERIETLPGVAAAEARITAEILLLLPDFEEPASARAISLPGIDGPVLNRIHLRAGRMPDPLRSGEILIGESFAAAHGLRPGDRLEAILSGRLQTLEITGIALSAEFIYEIREGDLLPDPRRFTVLWIGEADLAAAGDLDGAFNSVVLLLEPSATARAVMDAVDGLLEPYGGAGAGDRDDQMSWRAVTGELDQLRAMAIIAPILFLAVAAFLFNMTISRLVDRQREIIGLLKAFGYSGGAIARHFLRLAFVIAALGAIVGIAVGAWLGRALTATYASWFRFPVFDYVLRPGIIITATAISAGCALLGTLFAVRRAVRLEPAAAMRPPTPPQYHRGVMEWSGAIRYVPASLRMVLRQCARRPVRTTLTLLGLSFGVAIMVLGTYSADVIDELMDLQFGRVQRQDLTVLFTESREGRCVHECLGIEGVLAAQSFRAVPVRLRAGHRSRRVALLGMDATRPGGEALVALRDEAGGQVDVPSDGLLLSTALADLLAVRAGDMIEVEVLAEERRRFEMPVAATVADLSGLGAWISGDPLRVALREQDRVSGVHLGVDRSMEAEVLRDLREIPAVRAVLVKRAALAGFEETIARSILRMRIANTVFAMIIAVGVVLSSMRIALQERGRDLATLRVLGFTRGEVTGLLLAELLLLLVLAIPLGLVIGHWFAALATAFMQTETQRFPLVIRPATDALAVLVLAGGAALAAATVHFRIARLDLAATLRTAE